MNIAIIAHGHHPIKQPFVGGLEAHTHQLVAELIRQGHEVRLFAKAGTKTAGKPTPLCSSSVRSSDNPLYSYGYRRAMHRIANGNYDLIINNSLNYIPLLLHSVAMPPMITIFHTPPFPKMTNVLQAQAVRPNRSYIAVSDFTAGQWQPYCADQVHAVPNGMNLDQWQVQLDKPSELSAAWVGRITREKGTHVALQACLKAGVPVKFGGPIYDRAYFAKHIKPLLAHDSIQYVGHLDHTQVNALFANASLALVTPLWDEPFGLVEVEAWASGTPVAALPNGALPSLMRPDVGSLAASDSPDDLALAMQRALKVDRLACRRYATENFSLAAMVESYLRLMPVTVNDETMSLSWQTVQ